VAHYSSGATTHRGASFDLDDQIGSLLSLRVRDAPVERLFTRNREWDQFRPR
jgi:hypothetical protein